MNCCTSFYTFINQVILQLYKEVPLLLKYIDNIERYLFAVTISNNVIHEQYLEFYKCLLL